MSKEEQVENEGLDVEQLELNLGMFEIELDQKLKQLRESFAQPNYELDLTKLYYDHINSTEIKFKDLMGDLTTLLIKEEQSSTPNLRSTFFRIIENPLFALFKTSKFELFDLQLNGFDIEIEPLEALKEVHGRLTTRIQQYKTLLAKQFALDMSQIAKKVFKNEESFLVYSMIHAIEFKLFTLYSYLRKGAQLLRKTFESRLAVTEMFNVIEKQLVPLFVRQKFANGLKQISTLNFEIFNIEPTYDYFFFYFGIPLTADFLPVYLDINLVADKCHKTNNYNAFVQFFLKHHRGLREKLFSAQFTEDWVVHLNAVIVGAVRLLRSEVLLFDEFVQIIEWLLRQNPQILQSFLKYVPDKDKEALRSIHENYQVLVKSQPELVSTLKALTFDQVKERLENAQRLCLFGLDYSKLPKAKVQELNDILGGMPQVYFDFMEPILKKWNSTASLSNKHKYISSQFVTLKPEEAQQVLKHINNFLYLMQVYPKQYIALFETKLNYRYFLDLVHIISQHPEGLRANAQVAQYISSAFQLFQKLKSLKDPLPSEQQGKYYNYFSNAAFLLSDGDNYQNFSKKFVSELEKDKSDITIKEYVTLIANLKSSRFDPADMLVSGLLSDLKIMNEQVSRCRFHEMALESVTEEMLTTDEAEFVKKNFDIVSGELVARDSKIFKITNQDQTTNPLNLDSRIDDIFITLTPNSKKVLQVAVLELIKELTDSISELKPKEVFESRSEFLMDLFRKAVIDYPIVVPYLTSLKVNLKEIKATLAKKNNTDIAAILPDSATFAEFLTFAELLQIDGSIDLLLNILQRKQIKYINGNDFIRQQTAIAVIESSLKVVNHLRAKKIINKIYARTLSVLAASLEIQKKISKQQSDLIKNLIEAGKQEISELKEVKTLFELSKIYKRFIALYFKYKEQEMRNGVAKYYHEHKFDPIRNIDIKDLGKTQFLKVQKFIAQTLLTFSINFDFEVQNSILSKPKQPQQPVAAASDKKVPFSQLRRQLSQVDRLSPVKQQSTQESEPAKELNLSKSKNNIVFHLGESFVKQVAHKAGCVFRFNQDTVFPDAQDQAFKAEEAKNIALFYMKDVGYPQIDDALLEQAVVAILSGENSFDFMKNPSNYAKVVDLLSIVLLRNSWEFKQNTPINTYLQTIGADKIKQEQLINRILSIFSTFGYSNLFVNTYDDLSKIRIKAAADLLKASKLPTNEAILCLLLKFTLNKFVDKELTDFKEFSHFLKEFFEKRPKQNTALTYKIPVDKMLLNLMLKCIDFENLHYASILFYANFQNLRLYTEDIQEGFKALNLASKTRAYNEFLKLSKEYNDQEYLMPLKIFKENLKFFVKVEKEGYLFKRREEAAIAVERLVSVAKTNPKEPAEEFDKIMDSYLTEIGKLKINAVNRVRSMYLAAKLRDLSIQNGSTISLLYEILSSGAVPKDKIMSEISKIEIFSIITSLHYELLQFEHSFVVKRKYTHYQFVDTQYLSDGLIYPTTRRFGFNMGTAMQKCDFDFDDALQHALNSAKAFLVSDVGREWAEEHLNVNPAFFVENRIHYENKKKQLLEGIVREIAKPVAKAAKVTAKEATFTEDLRAGTKDLPNVYFINKGAIEFELDGAKQTLESITQKLANVLTSKQILIKAGKYLVFNRYKFSEDSLQLIEMLGSLLAGCIHQNLRIDLPLHHSIVCLIRSTMVDFDDLVDVDFKVWQYLKTVLSESDTKTLNLTFSYDFDSAKEPGKKQRLDLVDKGTSKKVNNLNREQFCDLICCKILFGFTQAQLDRFQIGLFKILPSELLSNTSAAQIYRTLHKQQFFEQVRDNPQLLRSLQMRSIRKFGLMQPELFIGKDRSFQNLKDFVNINWLLAIIADLQTQKLQQLANKLGSDLDHLNLKVYTKSGQTEAIEFLPQQKIIITHFGAKEKMEPEIVKQLS